MLSSVESDSGSESRQKHAFATVKSLNVGFAPSSVTAVSTW
jgi:hypothetical protein